MLFLVYKITELSLKCYKLPLMSNHSGAVSTAIQSGRQLPSVFEVIAQESLQDVLNPAFKHVVKVNYKVLVNSLQTF